jgi:transcriptional regulator with XRE-family HTH domain
MDNIRWGERLKALRKHRNWSQRYVSRQIGMSQPRLSQIESGKRHPTEKEWQALQSFLNTASTPLPERLQLPYPSQAWAVTRPEFLCATEVPLNARIYRARKSFGALFDRLLDRVAAREDSSLSLRFLHDACLDSGDETTFWVAGLAVGGRACWYSPARAGFRKFPVVDGPQDRKVIGDLRQPCLEILRSSYGLLLFPQLRLVTRRGFYRLDALVCVRQGRDRCWVNVEVDGGGHDGEFDFERQSQLQLPTIRLKKRQLADPDMFADLEKRLLAILQERKAG